MFSFDPQVDSSEIVLEKRISVKAAAEFTGYNKQYLRRLLRSGRLDGKKRENEAVEKIKINPKAGE